MAFSRAVARLKAEATDDKREVVVTPHLGVGSGPWAAQVPFLDRSRHFVGTS